MTSSNTEPTKDIDSKNLTSMRAGAYCILIGIDSSTSRRGHRHRPPWHGRKKGPMKMGRFGQKMRYGMIMSRLLDLGLTKGCVFQVIQSAQRGPVLLQVRGTRIALGHGLASKVLVREVPSPI